MQIIGRLRPVKCILMGVVNHMELLECHIQLKIMNARAIAICEQYCGKNTVIGPQKSGHSILPENIM
ncbi:hypothetical protein QR680_003465 [Steinernema hermaphroditum]|uniref:Uncharacterized protein n=1 Tax=Steinernema hermaphroditum TaxID=289476 RepID=A0AA39LKF3_9BILA|nr:hypothetical protein QR680_003465 [Steinernema hermaphroditum]